MSGLKVAITGGIGSGKSYVNSIFKVLNIPIFESDIEAKKLYNEQNVKEFVKAEFGQTVFRPDKDEIDFKILAETVFKDKNNLFIINRYIHPIVMRKYEQWHELQNTIYTINETAILFENKLESFFDIIITVVSDQRLRIKRVSEKYGITEEAVVVRINNQLDDDFKIKLSDYVIYNDEVQLLVPQIIEIHSEIIKRFHV